MFGLKNKRITLAVTGGIAAYKAANLVRLLVKEGASVHVVMTEAATKFVGPLTFEALSGNPVAVNAFDAGMPHLSLTRGTSDLLLVAPATANILAKAAHGIADDLVSSTILASGAPVAFAPAMNTGMWTNPATQRNIAQLKANGRHILGPVCGELACGETGAGRMIEPEEILAHVRRLLTEPVLKGKKIVITAGPTFEAIDPVRGITNLSSGRQGTAVARAAFEAGADVVLVAGPMTCPVPHGVSCVRVQSAREMLEAVQKEAGTAQAFIAVAAVADWRTCDVSQTKIKKTGELPQLTLTENPDILQTVQQAHPQLFCVGFAAETENLEDNARTKLEKKGVSMIIANNAREAIGAETNRALIVTREAVEDTGSLTKDELARRIITGIAQRL